MARKYETLPKEQLVARSYEYMYKVESVRLSRIFCKDFTNWNLSVCGKFYSTGHNGETTIVNSIMADGNRVYTLRRYLWSVMRLKP